MKTNTKDPPRKRRRVNTPSNDAERCAEKNHDARGRFVAGNGAARNRGAASAELRAALLAATSPADVRAVWRRLIALARRGNVHAISTFLDRVFGRPAQSVHAQLDVREIEPDYSSSLPDPTFL
jgi:hypothetical protein